MLSKDIKSLGDQFSFFVENHCEMTFSMSQMAGIVRELRSLQNQAEAMEHAMIADNTKQPEISPVNGKNIIILDHFRKNNTNHKTTA